MQELSSKHKIHAQQITILKSDFLENASSVFESKSAKDKAESDEEQFYNKIAHMQVQIDFLKKVIGRMSTTEKRQMLKNINQGLV